MVIRFTLFQDERTMSRCEDYPCCGHEPGCCPNYDENGRQTEMRCVCGASVPLSSRVSICESCLDRDGDEFDEIHARYRRPARLWDVDRYSDDEREFMAEHNAECGYDD